MMFDKMKMSKKLMFILGVMLFLNLTSTCFAELKTKKDLKDVLPAADMFARKTKPFGHYLGYAAVGRALQRIGASKKTERNAT